MQTNRLFEILYILLNKKQVTAKELAAHFEVSTRTIYRDVDSLSLSGIPIYTEKGKGGGISLLPNFVLQKSLLSEQEQNEILYALKGLSHMKVLESEQILEKMSALFNKDAADWLEVDFSSWSYEDGDLWNKLKNAILEKHAVEFDYYGGNGEKTRRFVEPAKLLFKSRSWYLKGFCHMRGEERLFKLSRVLGLKLTGEKFSGKAQEPDLSSSESPEDAPCYIEIKLRISPGMTYKVFDDFSASEVCRESDGSFLVSITWREDSWLYATILSYGEHIEVLEPGHIKAQLRDKAKKIMEKYL